MSIMVWQVMRKLPKPLLLIFLFFLLAAVARSYSHITPEKSVPEFFSISVSVLV